MSTTSNTGKQLVVRDANGKFAPGNKSGGRPRGSRDKVTHLYDRIVAHALATDPETGLTRADTALTELYATDKQAYVRFLVKLLPRPATVPPHTADLRTPVHVNQLFEMRVHTNVTVRPPLPRDADWGDKPHVTDGASLAPFRTLASVEEGAVRRNELGRVWFRLGRERN